MVDKFNCDALSFADRLIQIKADAGIGEILDAPHLQTVRAMQYEHLSRNRQPGDRNSLFATFFRFIHGPDVSRKDAPVHCQVFCDPG